MGGWFRRGGLLLTCFLVSWVVSWRRCVRGIVIQNSLSCLFESKNVQRFEVVGVILRKGWLVGCVVDWQGGGLVVLCGLS